MVDIQKNLYKNQPCVLPYYFCLFLFVAENKQNSHAAEAAVNVFPGLCVVRMVYNWKNRKVLRHTMPAVLP